MKKWIVIAIAVLLVTAGAYGLLARRTGNGVSYRFVSVEQGDLESIVSTTGTLSAVKTVEVGTQVSALIAKINVDFNDKVKEGQVIAELDTSMLESSVRDAEAALERNQAQLTQAKRDFERLEELHKSGISADQDYNAAQYNLDVARAQLKSSEASLARARQNLGYATIKAPVSGTVVERTVDVGQTVAASFSAPKLFVIANDLSEMQILAPVDESDIGQIKEGQAVRFTVKAYPDKKFTGTVKQVRLQSTVEQNVVNYTVVVGVKNPDGVLLPGMTATVEFLTATAKDVFKVANAALRFRPSEAMMAEVRARMQRERAAREAAAQGGGEGVGGEASRGSQPPGDSPRGAGDTAGQRAGAAGGVGGGFAGGGGLMAGGGFPAGMGGAVAGGQGANGARGPREMTMLYYLDADGKLAAMPVRTGITDGQSTEVRGRRVEIGMQVIASMTQSARSTSSNPFQQQGERHGPPGGF